MDRHDTSVYPNDSASHHGDEQSQMGSAMDPPVNPNEQPFPFKFKAPSGRIHRIQVAPNGGLIELLGACVEKLGNEIAQIGEEPEFGPDGRLVKQGFALSFVDNEGDVVSITSDADMVDAINMAKRTGRDKVDLYVHDPEKPAVIATVDPRPPPGASSSSSKKKARAESPVNDEEDEEEAEIVARKRVPRPHVSEAAKPEYIPGVPNDLLLPGSMVILAVSIIAVFAMSRK